MRIQMLKSELLDSVGFKNAPLDAKIKYVQADEKCFCIDGCTCSRGANQLYLDACYDKCITKGELLNDKQFKKAGRAAEILICFDDYHRETWGCDVECKNGVIYIRELI